MILFVFLLICYNFVTVHVYKAFHHLLNHFLNLYCTVPFTVILSVSAWMCEIFRFDQYSSNHVTKFLMFHIHFETIIRISLFCRKFHLNIILLPLTYHVRMFGLNVMRYVEEASQMFLKERLVQEELILIYLILLLQM
jgi:hypothetical protein